MPAPNDPRPSATPQQPPAVSPRAAGPAASAAPTTSPAGAQRLANARPESTVTLMIQSGQAPGALGPTRADAEVPQRPAGWLRRAWATVRRWF